MILPILISSVCRSGVVLACSKRCSAAEKQQRGRHRCGSPFCRGAHGLSPEVRLRLRKVRGPVGRNAVPISWFQVLLLIVAGGDLANCRFLQPPQRPETALLPAPF